MPSQQSTAPRRRRHCTACREQGHPADAACVVRSVPAARGNGARHCPDDCVLQAIRDPACTSSHYNCVCPRLLTVGSSVLSVFCFGLTLYGAPAISLI